MQEPMHQYLHRSTRTVQQTTGVPGGGPPGGGPPGASSLAPSAPRRRPESLGAIRNRLQRAFSRLSSKYRRFIADAWGSLMYQREAMTWRQCLDDQCFCQLFNLLMPMVPYERTKVRMLLDWAIARLEFLGEAELSEAFRFFLINCSPMEHSWRMQDCLEMAYHTRAGRIEAQPRLHAYLRLHHYISASQTGWRAGDESAKDHAKLMVGQLKSVYSHWAGRAKKLAEEDWTLQFGQVMRKVHMPELTAVVWTAYQEGVERQKQLMCYRWKGWGLRTAEELAKHSAVDDEVDPEPEEVQAAWSAADLFMP